VLQVACGEYDWQHPRPDAAPLLVRAAVLAEKVAEGRFSADQAKQLAVDLLCKKMGG